MLFDQKAQYSCRDIDNRFSFSQAYQRFFPVKLFIVYQKENVSISPVTLNAEADKSFKKTDVFLYIKITSNFI